MTPRCFLCGWPGGLDDARIVGIVSPVTGRLVRWCADGDGCARRARGRRNKPADGGEG